MPALAILVMLAALSVVLSLAFWGGVSKRFPRARHYLRRLPKGDILERSLDSCRQFGKHQGFLAKAIALSLLVNVVWVLQIYVLGRGLDMDITLRRMLMIVPIITCIAAGPPSLPTGWGCVRICMSSCWQPFWFPAPVALSPSLPASQESQDLIAKARTAALSLSCWPRRRVFSGASSAAWFTWGCAKKSISPKSPARRTTIFRYSLSLVSFLRDIRLIFRAPDGFLARSV